MTIEGIPDSYELVRIGKCKGGKKECYIAENGRIAQWLDSRDSTDIHPIVKQIEPPEPAYVPWTLETCPVGSVLVGPLDRVLIIRCNERSCCLAKTGDVLFADILQSAYRHDGEPCGTRVAK